MRAAVAVALLGLAACGGCRARSGGEARSGDAGDAAASRPIMLIGLAAPDGGAPRVVSVAEVDAGPMATGIPVPVRTVEAAINPGHFPPYSGPTGSVAGVVRVSGDQPPKRDLRIPFACGEAYATYGKAFREGNGRTLADALVAVTEYDGFVPPASDVQPVAIRGCAYDKRAYALTYGQRIEVQNTDPRETFLPNLLGAQLPAQIVAMPRGDTVKLYPLRVGHYALADGMNRTWMYADVFVLSYATHAVTDLDGHYQISGIPVGKVKVSAYLPAIDAGLHPDVGVAKPSLDRPIEIKAGETAQADFVIAYKAPKPAPPAATRPPGPVIR